MKFQLSGQNLRAISKSVRLLSKHSKDVLIIANEREMKLQVINDLKTAYVEIEFRKYFFDSYECNREIKFKLFMKSLTLVFRVLCIDKIFDICTVIMDESMPKIIVEMKSRRGMEMNYFIPYMESTHLRLTSSLKLTEPTFKAESKLMSECLHYFSSATKDISIWLTTNKIMFKSYCDDILEEDIVTSFEYKSNEFQNYRINGEISVTFNMRDLKPFVEFGNYRQKTIDCYFESSGNPIEFIINTTDHYSAKLLLATHEFPENNNPVPPSQCIPGTTQSSGNSSLHFSTDSSNERSISERPLNESSNVFHPECVLNTSVSNLETNSIENNTISNNTSQDEYPLPGEEDPFIEEEVDPFPQDDDDIIEEMLSQMPVFSADNFNESIPSMPTAEYIRTLDESALQRYQINFLYGNEEDDDPGSPNSQDILVPESDDEQ